MLQKNKAPYGQKFMGHAQQKYKPFKEQYVDTLESDIIFILKLGSSRPDKNWVKLLSQLHLGAVFSVDAVYV